MSVLSNSTCCVLLWFLLNVVYHFDYLIVAATQRPYPCPGYWSHLLEARPLTVLWHSKQVIVVRF